MYDFARLPGWRASADALVPASLGSGLALAVGWCLRLGEAQPLARTCPPTHSHTTPPPLTRTSPPPRTRTHTPAPRALPQDFKARVDESGVDLGLELGVQVRLCV